MNRDKFSSLLNLILGSKEVTVYHLVWYFIDVSKEHVSCIIDVEGQAKGAASD
jgi:hypothetical protein